MKINRLELSVVGDVEISTVQLPIEVSSKPIWETCLFFGNGDSEVVEQYQDENTARIEHRFIVDCVRANLNVNGSVH